MLFSAYDDDSDLSRSESEEQHEVKVMPRMSEDFENRPSYFARWFEMVPPNTKIHEDEYYWPSGQALEPDYFDDNNSLDRYLKYGEHQVPRKWDDHSESDDASPLTLSFQISSSESSGYSDIESLESLPLEPSESEDFEPVELTRELSDWSKMPPVLKPLEIEVSVPAPTVLEKQTSDWSLMPVLEPLWLRQLKEKAPIESESPINLPVVPVDPVEDTEIDVPAMDAKQSDWSVMPVLRPLGDWLRSSSESSTESHLDLPLPTMETKQSDWSEMPVLRPLADYIKTAEAQSRSVLSIPPAMVKESSDWSNVSNIVPEEVWETESWATEEEESDSLPQPQRAISLHNYWGSLTNEPIWQPLETPPVDFAIIPFLILANIKQQ